MLPFIRFLPSSVPETETSQGTVKLESSWGLEGWLRMPATGEVRFSFGLCVSPGGGEVWEKKQPGEKRGKVVRRKGERERIKHTTKSPKLFQRKCNHKTLDVLLEKHHLPLHSFRWHGCIPQLDVLHVRQDNHILPLGYVQRRADPPERVERVPKSGETAGAGDAEGIAGGAGFVEGGDGAGVDVVELGVLVSGRG